MNASDNSQNTTQDDRHESATLNADPAAHNAAKLTDLPVSEEQSEEVKGGIIAILIGHTGQPSR